MSVTLDFGGPAELVRGVEVVLAPVLRSAAGGALTPSAWTAVLRSAAGGAWSTVASTSGTTSLSWALTVAATVALGDDYEILWSITTSAGVVTSRQAAVVCLSRLYPVLRVEDLYVRAPTLNPATRGHIEIVDGETGLIEVMAAAWRDVLSALRQKGQRSHLIVDSEDLREPHLERTLAILYQSAATSLGEGAWLTLAESREAAWTDYWRRASFRVAPADPAEGVARRRAASLPLIAGGFGGAFPTHADWESRGRR